MKRPLRPDETRLWATVVATVRPAPGKSPPEIQEEPAEAQAAAPAKRSPRLHPTPKPKRRPTAVSAPERIEPGRHRRIARERDLIEARIDLHGMDQDRAREALHGFLRWAHDRGLRAVLVITGKGTVGDGVLRRRTPEWLSEAKVRPLVAGIAHAERRHGGEGALYVALKRKADPRG